MVSTPCGALCRGVHLVLRHAFLWPFWGVLASVQRGQPEGARGQYVGCSPYSPFVPHSTRPSLSSALPCTPGGWSLWPTSHRTLVLQETAARGWRERKFIREFSPHSLLASPQFCVAASRVPSSCGPSSTAPALSPASGNDVRSRCPSAQGYTGPHGGLAIRVSLLSAAHSSAQSHH